MSHRKEGYKGYKNCLCIVMESGNASFVQKDTIE